MKDNSSAIRANKRKKKENIDFFTELPLFSHSIARTLTTRFPKPLGTVGSETPPNAAPADEKPNHKQ